MEKKKKVVTKKKYEKPVLTKYKKVKKVFGFIVPDSPS